MEFLLFKTFSLRCVSFIFLTGDLTQPLLWQCAYAHHLTTPPVYGSPSISFSLIHNQSPVTLLLWGAPTSPLTTYCICVQILWIVAINGKAWDSIELSVPAQVPATYIPTSLKLPSSHGGSSFAHLTNCTGHLSRSQVPQVCFLSGSISRGLGTWGASQNNPPQDP